MKNGSEIGGLVLSLLLVFQVSFSDRYFTSLWQNAQILINIVLVGSLIASLPRTLQVRGKNEQSRRIESQKVLEKEQNILIEDPRYASPMKAAVTLFKNAPYVLICFSMAFEGGFLAIVATYIVKYRIVDRIYLSTIIINILAAKISWLYSFFSKNPYESEEMFRISAADAAVYAGFCLKYQKKKNQENLLQVRSWYALVLLVKFLVALSFQKRIRLSDNKWFS